MVPGFRYATGDKDPGVYVMHAWNMAHTGHLPFQKTALQMSGALSVPNVATTIYTPSTTAYPNAVTTPTADAATAVYRGVAFYLPVGCSIQDVIFDTVQAPATDGTTPAYATYVSNNFATTTGNIATVGTLTTGARTSATFSAAQLPNAKSTTSDINQGNGNPSLSQVVVTFAMTAASGITTISAGTLTLVNQLATSSGGTGLQSFTANGVFYAGSSSTMNFATGSPFQVMQLNSLGVPAFAGLDGGQF